MTPNPFIQTIVGVVVPQTVFWAHVFCWATPLPLSAPHSGCYSEGGARSHAPRRLSTRIAGD